MEGDSERIGVCEWIYERLFGRTLQHLIMEAKHPNEYELAGVQKAIVIRDVQEVIDADSEELTDADSEWDQWA